MKYGFETAALLVATLLAMLAAAFSKDPLFQAHAWILFAVLAISSIVMLRRASFAGAAEIPLKEDGNAAYMDEVVKYGVIATTGWGIVGFLVGVLIALQMAWPAFNIEPYLNFGRLRPLHTSAVIFAFGGNALLATSFYVVQRTTHLAWFVFWGYQLFIVMAATGYVLGITQGREYAEPEWYVDLWLTIVWVALPGRLCRHAVKRKEPHIYVANWFYLAFIITIAMLHVVNNLAVPVSFLGYQELLAVLRRAGRADPVVVRPQRGGLLPDRRLPRHDVLLRAEAGQPAGLLLPPVDRALLVADLPLHLGGPHHLHYTALPDWAQTLGMVFSDHAVDALLGRHDQRPDDAVGRVGQAAHRPDPAHDGRLAWLLRHEHLRRPADVDQARSTRSATTPTGPSAMCIPARWAGSA
jgi:cytochrome c oxidase cbb3-type subunit 1